MTLIKFSLGGDKQYAGTLLLLPLLYLPVNVRL